MKSINPVKLGVVFAVLGGAFHVVRVILVVLGRAQPHTIGSLSFPLTALIIISATAAAGFIVGYALAAFWNRLTAATMLTRAVWLIVCVVIIAAVGSVVWGQFLSPVKVVVAAVQRDVMVEVFGLGTVEARVTSKIGFKVSGVLVDLRADVGDRVAKGAVLARLDDREQSAQVARAKAAVEQTEASLQKARASVEKAKANLANTKSINERRQKLVQTNITSVEAAQTAQAAQDAAAADLNLANSDVLVAEANISDAKASQQLQSTTLGFYTLMAPYDAMVTARLKELGSALGAGEPVFTLIDPKSVWVLAYIDESKAGEIRVGEPAGIILRSQPNRRIAGHVARIEPESDRVNEERRVEIAFDRIPANANLGEQAEVYITTVTLPQALLVPEAAIVGLGKNGGTVWTVENGRLQQRDVKLGHRLLDGRYEITLGVPDKAMVVSQLRSGLRAGRAAIVEAKITRGAD
jgi:HlyD family secretion protein